MRRRSSLEEPKVQREDRFLRGRQIACMIHDCFQVTGAHDTVLDHADLFTITHRNDDVQEFDTSWDEILLSMTKITPDDVQESFYKFKTVLELFDMEIHLKVSMFDDQILKTMEERSTDQKLRLRNFDARNEN